MRRLFPAEIRVSLQAHKRILLKKFTASMSQSNEEEATAVLPIRNY